MREKVGCLHTWDKSSDIALPPCANIQDFQDYKNVSLKLAFMDIEELVSETGCQVPCKYTKYSIPNYVPEAFPIPKYVKRRNKFEFNNVKHFMFSFLV